MTPRRHGQICNELGYSMECCPYKFGDPDRVEWIAGYVHGGSDEDHRRSSEAVRQEDHGAGDR